MKTLNKPFTLKAHSNQPIHVLMISIATKFYQYLFYLIRLNLTFLNMSHFLAVKEGPGEYMDKIQKDFQH